MPSKRALKLRCPICKKTVKAGEPDFPFCRDRCRSIDLGKWATGAYVIPSSEIDEAEDTIPRNHPDATEED